MNMKYNTKGLDFHQTFKPERSCLSSMLTDLQVCSGKTAQEISKLTGIPTGASSGKVVPTILYMEYMGLITENLVNKKFELSFTALGDKVFSEDPGLMENLTLLLLHCMLVRKNNGADLWNFIICGVLAKYHGFIRKETLNKELELHFGKEPNLAPFHGTYNGIFDQLGILDITEDGYSLKPHSFNPEYVFLYGLVLYEYWEDWISGFSKEDMYEKNISFTEITADQLEETGFRQAFGWTGQDEYQALEALNDKGIISLNRQMSPFAVRKLYTKEQMIDMLYSELC